MPAQCNVVAAAASNTTDVIAVTAVACYRERLQLVLRAPRYRWL